MVHLLVTISGELEFEGIELTWAAAQSRIELAFARRRRRSVGWSAGRSASPASESRDPGA
jgi:hypothetical protein